jgi:hypothetical protein
MPKTLIVEDDEIACLVRASQKMNADLPTQPGLATLTPKIAALTDPDPEPAAPPPAEAKSSKK